MSKRINPLSFRLGLSQPWKLNANLYGQNFELYTKLLDKKSKIVESLSLSLLSLRILSDIKQYKVHKNYWKVSTRTCYLDSHKDSDTFRYFSLIFKPIYYWTKKPLSLNLYKQPSKVNSALLICYWIKFYFKENKSSLKSIIALLETELTSSINKKKIQSNKFGLKLLKLKGIKISCKGRLGNIRNPLTQVFTKTWGSTSLTKLNNYVEYSQDYILTKRGSYGLQVWIFYS